jgi:hypothetical protein
LCPCALALAACVDAPATDATATATAAQSIGAGSATDPWAVAQAQLSFNADFTTTRAGILRASGTLTVHYDSSRLAPCAEVQQGRPQWAITAHIRFDTGDEFDPEVLGSDATITVPTDGPSTVALWFEATNVDGCHQWDSAYGANYNFALAMPPQWVGLPTNTLSRDSSARCGAADANDGFAFDTWARSQAVETNFCFQVYQAGQTDVPNPDLWEELDTQLYWRLVGANGAGTAWTATPVDLDAARIGNNASYVFDWRTIDPFRDYHCPEVASVPTADGMYQQITVEYAALVNGTTLAPEHDTNESDAPVYSGTFIDYPSNPWRTANCH